MFLYWPLDVQIVLQVMRYLGKQVGSIAQAACLAVQPTPYVVLFASWSSSLYAASIGRVHTFPIGC